MLHTTDISSLSLGAYSGQSPAYGCGTDGILKSMFVDSGLTSYRQTGKNRVTVPHSPPPHFSTLTTQNHQGNPQSTRRQKPPDLQRIVTTLPLGRWGRVLPWKQAEKLAATQA